MEAEVVIKRSPGRPRKEDVTPTGIFTVEDVPNVSFPKRMKSIQFHAGEQFRALVRTGLNTARDNCSIWMMDHTGHHIIDVKHPNGETSRHHVFGSNVLRSDE